MMIFIIGNLIISATPYGHSIRDWIEYQNTDNIDFDDS